MRTLEDIRGRCFITEDGHWLWRGALRPDGRPNIYAPDYTFDPAGTKLRSQAGPRAVWHCHTGAPIRDGWRVFGTCDEKACCNPEHMRCISCALQGVYVRRTGVFKGRTTRIRANRAINRKRTVRTPEAIAHIQASQATGVQLARDLGISTSVVSRARRGNVRSLQAASGMFAALCTPVAGPRILAGAP